MAINERQIRINVQEGQVSKNLTDILNVLEKGQSSIKVNVQVDGDKSFLKSLESGVRIEPIIDIASAQSQLSKIESEFELFRNRLSQPINLNIGSGGQNNLNAVAQSMKQVASQAQTLAQSGKSISSAYAQAGDKVTASVRNIKRQMEDLGKLEQKALATSFRTTQAFAGLSARKFTPEELKSGASTRLDQRLLLRGLDQAAIIPGNITRQTAISPSAAGSEYIRQEQNLERLARKKEQLETKLQDRLEEEQIRAAERRQATLTSIARKASSQNINVASLSHSDASTTSLLGEIANIQGALKQDPVQQAKELVTNAAKANKIAKEEFEKKIGVREFFSALPFSPGSRTNERLKRIPGIVEQHPDLPGLDERLQLEAKAGKLPSRFDLTRLKDPGVATQVAFGAVFGGGKGLASAALGGAIGGVPGALAAATIQQAVEALVGPIIEGINHKKEEFREAGLAFEGSILSISSTLQQTTEILGPGGRPLGDKNIQAQLAFQEREATQIQLAARKNLLPQGIGGGTEATFVRGIVAALGQRGIKAEAGEVSEIARILAGVIQTQRPELLNNPSLLNRDLQDVLSGLPQANRTLLGSLIRPSLPKLSKATTGAGVVSALQNQSAFADVAINSTNPQALANKLSGAEDQLKTVGGEAFLKAQSAGVQIETSVLKMQVMEDSARNLGEALGNLDGSMRVAGVGFRTLGAVIVNGISTYIKDTSGAFDQLLSVTSAITSMPVFKTLGLSSGKDYLEWRQKSEEEQKLAEKVQELQAIQARATSTGQINAGLEGVGLFDEVERFNTSRQQSTFKRLFEIDRQERLFGDTDRFKELAPALFASKIDLLDKEFKDRSSIFTGQEGEIQSGRLFRSDIAVAQSEAAEKRRAASLERINDALKKNEESEKSKITISDQLQKEQLTLQSLQLKRTTAPLSNLENANSLVEEAKIKGRISDLRLQDKDLALSAKTGDSNIQNLTDQLIEASREELKLKDQVVQSSQKEVENVLSRLNRISQVFDQNTGIGALADAARSLTELNEAAQGASDVVAQLDSELKSIGNLREGVIAAIGSTSDPGVRKLREKQLADLNKKEEEVSRRRLDAQDQQNIIERQRLAKIGQREEARNIPLLNRVGFQDTFTFAGQDTAAKLSRAVSLNRIESNQSQIRQIEDLIARNPNIKTRAALEQRKAALTKQIGDETLNVTQQERTLKTTPFDRDITKIDLSLSLKKSSRLIEDEALKRRELNTSLQLSSVRLRNFSEDLKASNSLKEHGLFGIADRLKSLGADVPEFLNVDPDTRNQFEIGAAREEGNALARKFGLGNIFSGGTTLNLTRTGSEVALEGEQQEFSLKKGIRDIRIELEDLAAVFRRMKLSLQKEQFIDRERFKPGERRFDNIPTRTIDGIVPPPNPRTPSPPLPVPTNPTEPSKSPNPNRSPLPVPTNPTLPAPGAPVPNGGPISLPIFDPNAPTGTPILNRPPYLPPSSTVGAGDRKFDLDAEKQRRAEFEASFKALTSGQGSLATRAGSALSKVLKGQVAKKDLASMFKASVRDRLTPQFGLNVKKGASNVVLGGGLNGNRTMTDLDIRLDRMDQESELKRKVMSLSDYDFDLYQEQLSKDPKTQSWVETVRKWRYPPGNLYPNILDEFKTTSTVTTPGENGNSSGGKMTKKGTSATFAAKKPPVPEITPIPSSFDVSEKQPKLIRSEFPQLDVPITEITPNIQVRPKKGFGPKESPAHADLRAQIASDLAGAFSGSNSPTGVRFPDQGSELAGELFQANSRSGKFIGKKTFVPGMSLSNVSTPGRPVPRLPAPPDVFERETKASGGINREDAKQLTSAINKFAQAVTTLSQSGIPLSQAAISDLGSVISNVFQ